MTGPDSVTIILSGGHCLIFTWEKNLIFNKRIMKRWVWIVLIVSLIAAITGFAGKKLHWFGNGDATEVELAKVKKADITEKVSASGKVQPEVEVKISADVSGEIIELAVREGDSVTKGQLLFRIRPDNYQSFLDRARAALNTAHANHSQAKATLAQANARLIRTRLDHERNRKLYEQKVIPEAEWETSKANFEVAENELEAARSNAESARFGIENAQANLKDAAENLRKTTVYAPMGGIVSRLNVEEGERVVGTAQMSGTEVLRIANLRNMEVEVEVNENDIVRIQVGDSAEIEVDSYAYLRRKFKGVVTTIANSAVETATAETVTEFKVEVKLDPASYRDLIVKNPGSYPFRPGMTASLEILTDHRENILTVPLSSVASRLLNEEIENGKKVKSSASEDEKSEAERRREESSGQKPEVVFVYKEGKVEMRKVITGIADFEQVEIREGLKEGEQVVSGPFTAVTKTLQSGDEVKQKENTPKNGKKESAAE
jgi:HlyD family secretion protein